MLLRNYDNLIAMQSLPKTGVTTITDTNVFGDGHLNLKDLSGNIKSNYYGSSSVWENHWLPFQNMGHNSGSSIINTNNYHRETNIITGSGDTEVSYDDFNLASPFSSTQVNNAPTGVTIGALTYNSDTESWERTITVTILALQDIEVKEIGAITGAKTGSETSGTYNVLVWREVLDEPVSVSADGTFKVSLTISIAANANKPADYHATVSVE